MCATKNNLTHSLAKIPLLDTFPRLSNDIPNIEQCMSLLNKFHMMAHIKEHSEQVAILATSLAKRAVACGYDINIDEVRASALLHDIAKTYTINHGGSHAQLGASWVLTETGNQCIAQGILFHVYWPWQINEKNICSLPFLIIYADKRIMHNKCVHIDERYEDLLQRYGHSESSRQGILISHKQAQHIENMLATKLDWDMYADTLNSGRLV